MAMQHRGQQGVSLTFTGDGATSAGLFHETLNLASVFGAPFIVVVENNQFAYSTPLHEQMKVSDIATRALGYDIPGVVVDGNDVEAVYGVVLDAAARARAGNGPTLIEAKTMRMRGHAIHDGAEYVPAELLADWEQRDPVETYRRKLIEGGTATASQLDDVLTAPRWKFDKPSSTQNRARCRIHPPSSMAYTPQARPDRGDQGNHLPRGRERGTPSGNDPRCQRDRPW